MRAEEKRQYAADRVEMSLRRREHGVLLDAHGDARSIPSNKIKTLKHIIDDPIIKLSSGFVEN